ncbi:MAG: hypothetical protein LBR18_08630 [Tannerella sp.]|jgi:hypothetical protein|nr:hypothetical protein [Tannerella sp.]
MKIFFAVKDGFVIVALLLCACSLFPEEVSTQDEWREEEYRLAGTAKDIDYLSDKEKEVYYYINLARINPPLFARTFAKEYDGEPGYLKGYAWDARKATLLDELKAMKPLPVLMPDSALYASALCFAREGGRLGIVGHGRDQTGCTVEYSAECCHYGGSQNGLSVVMSLLIDAGENNGALGHRRILLNDSYIKLGVSIQPHALYGSNTVLDFGR